MTKVLTGRWYGRRLAMGCDSEWTLVTSCPRNQNPPSGDLMEEQRKHAILFAANLLCARKLMESMETDKPNFAKQSWVDRQPMRLRTPWRKLTRGGRKPRQSG